MSVIRILTSSLYSLRKQLQSSCLLWAPALPPHPAAGLSRIVGAVFLQGTKCWRQDFDCLAGAEDGCPEDGRGDATGCSAVGARGPAGRGKLLEHLHVSEWKGSSHGQVQRATQGEAAPAAESGVFWKLQPTARAQGMSAGRGLPGVTLGV